MDENGLKNLLKLGFTYEDLYMRGLLILKPTTTPQTAENAQTAPQTAENAQTTPQTAENAQTTPQTAENAQTAPQTAENAQTAPQTAENAQTAETMSPEMVKMWKAFDFFKDEIKRMIQGVNTQNATRTEDAQQMTVAAAIQGLYKGDKT